MGAGTAKRERPGRRASREAGRERVKETRREKKARERNTREKERRVCVEREKAQGNKKATDSSLSLSLSFRSLSKESLRY